MPLAIELAAARIKLLTPDQILARLEHHLALLTAGSRDLPERQQTLRGAIAWSYDLLDEGAKRLVDRLSVFRGGWELEMAETVCGPSDELGIDVFDGIGALVDQSLVRIDDTTGEGRRFVMLDTIREYAAEMLATRGEADAFADRHAHAMLALAERAAPHLAGAEQRDWLDRLERDHDNLRAALEWATARPDPDLGARMGFALWRFWQQRGYLNEARIRFEAMAARTGPSSPSCAAHFAEAIGGVAYWQADHPAAERWYHEALRIWREHGDKREIANALYNDAYADILPLMGLTRRGADRRAAGRRSTRWAWRSSRRRWRSTARSATRPARATSCGRWGAITTSRPTRCRAEHWYTESLKLHRAAGHRTMEAWSLHMLGARPDRHGEVRRRARQRPSGPGSSARPATSPGSR